MSEKKTTEQFIEEAKKVHGNKYDYSLVEYIRPHAKVNIICHKKDEFGEEHGIFSQAAYSHLNGFGCPKCGGVYKYNTNSFIEKANKIHEHKYDYSKVDYINNKTKVCIICPKHGEFWQTPHMHLNGQGCKKCGDEKGSEKRKLTKEQCINLFHKIHGIKYSYDNFEYLGYDVKSRMICPIHGEFLQTPHMHIGGNGCPRCKQSHMEGQIDLILSNNGIDYKYNDKPNFLNGLEADFYLESHNIIIECQGKQHLISGFFFEPLEVVIERDKRKRTLSNENGKKIIYVIPFKHKDILTDEKFNHMYDDALFIEDIIKDNNILLNKIKSEAV